MSRIGKKPIEIAEGVKVEVSANEIKVSGPKGELKQALRPEIKVQVQDKQVLVAPAGELPKKGRGLWGLYRALIANMVEGVSKGFEKKLEIEGVGFKAAATGDKLVLNLGFVNPVEIKKPEGITFLVEKNIVTVSGIDKQLGGEMAAIIRKQKKAEPYKGKGIKYQGEKIRRKEGKKVVSSK
jgi:large subunit ribosomal protein L6